MQKDAAAIARDWQAASCPSTDPDCLVELAATGDRQLRHAIAANPNTPMSLLWELGVEFPEALAANPILLLLPIANPGIAKAIPLATLRQLVRSEALPIALLAAAARRGDFQIEQALTANPQTPAATLNDLSRHPTLGVREAAKLHIALAGELPANKNWQEPACQAAIALLRRGRACLLACSHAPVLLLHWLAASDAPLLRETVARNPIAPPEILVCLASDPIAQVRQAIAGNPATPPTVLAALGCDLGANGLRVALAGNPQTPPAPLADLARETLAAMQRQITAIARSASGELLENALQPQWQILLAIARNPSASELLLERILATLASVLLGADLSSQASQTCRLHYARWRRRLAGHPQISPTRATQLFGPDLLARLQVEVNQSPLATADADLPFGLLREIADNPRTPPAALAHLADAGMVLRREIARNRALTPELCTRLARDRDPQVRSNLAANPATPTTILASFLADPDPIVRTAAIAPYLKRVPTDRPRLLSDALATTARDRAFVWLFHPQMPAAALAGRAFSLDWLERCAIAQNPNTPEPCLQRLARDGNRVVRGAARAALSQDGTGFQSAPIARSDSTVPRAD